MAVRFLAWGNNQFVIPTTGAPASGYRLYTYVAGSSTLVTTYTTSAGNVAQSNPIILNSAGFPTTGQIWITEGTTVKIVFTDAADVVIKTEDNIPGTNDTASSSDEWVSGPAPTYISATSLSLVGDQTATFHVGRRLKTTNTAGTTYSQILTSAYTTLTTLTVTNTSGVLDSGLSAISYGLLSATNSSLPNTLSQSFIFTADQVINGIEVGRGAGNIASNTVFGDAALDSNTTGSSNTAIGTNALTANTSASNNTAIGNNALLSNTTGTSNIAIGVSTLDLNSTGSNNVAIGVNALGANTTASDNTAVGTSSLLSSTTGFQNVAIGSSALAANTTASNNTAVGSNSLSANTSGGSCTAVGSSALAANTTASSNTAVGTSTLAQNTTGASNTAIGTNAITASTTASNNTAVGFNALASGTTGASNTAVGLSALGGSTTGFQNTALGRNAGSNMTTGSNNTILGDSSSSSTATINNEFTLGNNSVTALRCQVTTITALSDKRDKKQIEGLSLGLDFINRLNPVRFKWDMRDGTTKPDSFEAGFIAQELQSSQEQFDCEWLGLVYQSNPDRLEASPGKLLPIMVRALQQLSADNDDLRARLKILESH